MDGRQKDLFSIIITEYIKTAQPVGSKIIAQIGNFDLSSATIRNEMAELENLGYICQPYTSAGRQPTEKGWQFYVNNFLEPGNPGKKHQELLNQAVKTSQTEYFQAVKNLAKTMADLTEEAVFVGFSPNNFYYTGLSNLFSQPEFSQPDIIYHLGTVIDHFDQIINEIFSEVKDQTQIFVGRKNPFGRDGSSLLARYKTKNSEGVLGILGPLRMDYEKNYSILNYSQNLINNLN